MELRFPVAPLMSSLNAIQVKDAQVPEKIERRVSIKKLVGVTELLVLTVTESVEVTVNLNHNGLK